MATAQIFHLLPNPPVADYPDQSTIISATTPDIARLTTQLLDPAVPVAGATQQLAEVKFPAIAGNSTQKAGTGVTVANPTVLTVTAHGYTTSDVVAISASNTTPTINGIWAPGNITANTFTIPVNVTSTASQTFNVEKTIKLVYGRWITRQLPAQVIGAGNWSFYGLQRSSGTATPFASATFFANQIWGFCVAQWRAGTGVVARFLDSPTTGTGQAAATNFDRAQLSTVAGVQLTLTANDQIVLEVWSNQWMDAGGSPVDLSLCYNGMQQYENYNYTVSTYTDTDAFLKAPAAISYQ